MKKTWQEKTHNAFVHFLLIPMYIYEFVVFTWQACSEQCRETQDYFFLKRINMTRQEFDVFMHYVTRNKEEYHKLLIRLGNAELILNNSLTSGYWYVKNAAERYKRLYTDFPFRVPEVESGEGKSYKTQVNEQLRTTSEEDLDDRKYF